MLEDQNLDSVSYPESTPSAFTPYKFRTPRTKYRSKMHVEPIHQDNQIEEMDDSTLGLGLVVPPQAVVTSLFKKRFLVVSDGDEEDQPPSKRRKIIYELVEVNQNVPFTPPTSSRSHKKRKRDDSPKRRHKKSKVSKPKVFEVEESQESETQPAEPVITQVEDEPDELMPAPEITPKLVKATLQTEPTLILSEELPTEPAEASSTLIPEKEETKDEEVFPLPNKFPELKTNFFSVNEGFSLKPPEELTNEPETKTTAEQDPPKEKQVEPAFSFGEKLPPKVDTLSETPQPKVEPAFSFGEKLPPKVDAPLFFGEKPKAEPGPPAQTTVVGPEPEPKQEAPNTDIPTPKFTFDDKKTEEAPKAPTFSFAPKESLTPASKLDSDLGFKLDNPISNSVLVPSTEPIKQLPATTFSFGTPADTKTDGALGFSLTGNQPLATPPEPKQPTSQTIPSTFTFGPKSPETQTPAIVPTVSPPVPSLALPSSTPATSVFTFGATPAAPTSTPTTAPSVTAGSGPTLTPSLTANTTNLTGSGTIAQTPPVFSFGATPAPTSSTPNTASSASLTSSGTVPQTAAPPSVFSFGATSTPSVNSAASANPFPNLGGSTMNSTPNVFPFGATPPSAPPNDLFSLGTQQPKQAAAGSSSSEVFSFGSATTQPAKPPAGGAGAVFNFGSSQPSATPTFPTKAPTQTPNSPAGFQFPANQPTQTPAGNQAVFDFGQQKSQSGSFGPTQGSQFGTGFNQPTNTPAPTGGVFNFGHQPPQPQQQQPAWNQSGQTGNAFPFGAPTNPPANLFGPTGQPQGGSQGGFFNQTNNQAQPSAGGASFQFGGAATNSGSAFNASQPSYGSSASQSYGSSQSQSYGSVPTSYGSQSQSQSNYGSSSGGSTNSPTPAAGERRKVVGKRTIGRTGSLHK